MRNDDVQEMRNDEIRSHNGISSPFRPYVHSSVLAPHSLTLPSIETTTHRDK